MNIKNIVNKGDVVYNVKSYQKSKKYRPKVFNKSIKNRKKITYNPGGRKRYFYLSNTEIAAKKIIKRYDFERYFKRKWFYIWSTLFLLFLLKKIGLVLLIFLFFSFLVPIPCYFWWTILFFVWVVEIVWILCYVSFYHYFFSSKKNRFCFRKT